MRQAGGSPDYRPELPKPCCPKPCCPKPVYGLCKKFGWPVGRMGIRPEFPSNHACEAVTWADIIHTLCKGEKAKRSTSNSGASA